MNTTKSNLIRFEVIQSTDSPLPLALLPAALEALVVGDVIRLLTDFLYIKMQACSRSGLYESRSVNLNLNIFCVH